MKRFIVFINVFTLILLSIPPHTQSYQAPPEPVIELTKPTIKEYAKQATIDAFGGQWASMNTIIAKESNNWKVTTAHYPKSKKSTAYGLCGFLNATWKTTKVKKTSDPYKQIDACLEYVKERYGTPSKALAFHNKNHWF